MNKFFSFLVLAFLSILPFESYAHNCSDDLANLYFSNPSEILEKYNEKFYCSDILYLLNSNKENISLAEYKKLYPEEVINNVDYLRFLGITPDVFSDNLEEFANENFTTKEDTDVYLKYLISEVRSDKDYIVVNDKDFEEELFSKYPIGSILNAEKNFRNCSAFVDEQENIYPNNASYTQIISGLPISLRPVYMDSGNMYNIFNEKVAILRNNKALGQNIRDIEFSNPKIFSKMNSTVINWKDKYCKTNTLKEIAEKNSNCYLCPYIILVFNEISYLFNFLYDKFYDVIIKFLFVFGVFYMAFAFLKRFKNMPFDSDFNDYPKDILKKFQLIIITIFMLLVPPKNLFEWTVEPIINLTVNVSNSILHITAQNKYFNQSCNPDTVVDNINSVRNKNISNQALPPIVKEEEKNKNFNDTLSEDSIISKDTMGEIICFLSETLSINGKQMTMGSVLLNPFKSGILGSILGIIIVGMYFLISLFISFYILDGLIAFLKIAFVWPFYIFSYVFPETLGGGFFSVKKIITEAKKFGYTMINLAVFSIFNVALLESFYFLNSKENILQIVDKAIEDNDRDIIINNVPTDLLSVSKFLFIIFCIYYLYANLKDLAASYGNSEGAGAKPIGDSIRKIVSTTKNTATSITRESAGFVKGINNKTEEEKTNKEIESLLNKNEEEN